MDVKEGRVYISRDVVFDEIVFPFASLHPNAGARLCSEILLLHENLANLGGNNCDTDLISSPISNDACESIGSLENSAGPADFVSSANLQPERC